MRRIGAYVDRSHVVAVVVERGTAVWTASASVEPGIQSAGGARVASVLGSLLDRVPKYGWRALGVDVALGAPWARVKLLKGVPSVGRKRELLSMLRLSTSRFVASSRPVFITGAGEISAGEVEIGVADLQLVEAITREIAGHDLRAGRVVPAIAVDLEPATSDSPDNVVAAGEATLRQAIATRVASPRRSTRFDLMPADNPAVVIPDVSRMRIAIAAVALGTALVIYAAGHVDSERASLARDRAAIHSIATLSDSGVHERAELGGLSRDMAGAVKFSRQRVSTALLLGAITQALPADAAITTMRIDTASVDIVTLSPRAAVIVDALSDIASVATPAIIGPVSRETVGPRELERATIRMRIVPNYGHAKTEFEVARSGGR